MGSKSADKIIDLSLTDLNWLQTAEEEGKKNPTDVKDLAGMLPVTGVHPPRSRGNQEGRPQLSFAGLISLAIGSTKNGGLTLSGIYEWIEEAFPFFKSEKAKAWKNSVRHNLSVRKVMFEKLVSDGQSKRSRAAVWLLKDPEGTRELDKAVATLPSIDSKAINREFVESTLHSKSFHTGMTRSQPAVASNSSLSSSFSGSDLDITQQARSFLSRYSSSDQLVGNPPTGPEPTEDCERTFSAEEDENSSCVIRKRPALSSSSSSASSSVYILKKRKSFSSQPSRTAQSVCYDITNCPAPRPKSKKMLDNFITPPRMSGCDSVTSPTLFQLFANGNVSPSPGGFNMFGSPLTPLKGLGGLEMDSGINITPLRSLVTVPMATMSPGLIPPLSNSTPQGVQSSHLYDSGLNTTHEFSRSDSGFGMRRELF